MSSTVAQIKEKLGIVDVVSSYVTLERAGKNMKGTCPFHNEKTPSFFVSPERDTYHCFGCDKGGDIFSFVEEIEGLDFRGALKVLAGKAGVELEVFDKGEQQKKERLFSVMERATLLFEEERKEHKEVMTYLKARGLEEKTIRDFRIGFAKDEWRGATDALVKAGVKEEDLVETGISIKKDGGGYYDRFRGRIMFPIHDVSGRVVAFSGRVFGKDDTGAKYINSPETILYHKGSVLYALEKAKGELRKEGVCIITEGQMDAILSHQAGFPNTVATSGTALSEEQLTYLSRFTDTLIMAFDADSAGIAASGRGIDLALKHNFTVKVVRFPHGKDPAEIIKEDPKMWEKLVKGAVNIVEFYLAVLHETTKDEHEYRRAVEKKILPYIASMKSKIDQAHYVSKVADALGIAEEPVWEELARTTTSFSNGNIQKGKTHKETQSDKTPHETRKDAIRERLLGILLWQSKEEKPHLDREKLSQEYERVLGENPQKILDAMSAQEQEQKIFEAEMHFEESAHLQAEVEELLAHLQEHILKERLMKAMRELRSAEARSDTTTVTNLLELCHGITKELNELTQKKTSSH